MDCENRSACIKLLRPATASEQFYFNAYEYGNSFDVHYCLTFCSSKRLEESVVRKALLHLLRKVPTLRVYFRHHEGTLWACEMNHEDLDFAVTEEADMLEAQVEAMDERFRTAEGPLWFARLLPSTSKGDGQAEPNSAFSYRRNLIFSAHHSISDGHTNSLTVDLLIRILDDVMKRNPIDDHEQLGEFVNGDEAYAKLAAKTVQLKNNTEQVKLLRAVKNEERQNELLTSRAFNLPKQIQATTLMKETELDEETTTKFFRKSKGEGVTINSSFTAVIMGCLIEMAKNSGIKEDKYHLSVLHAVNMRKYWIGDASKALGLHSSAFTHLETIPSAWQDNFWEYARSVHRSLMANIEEDQLMTQRALMSLDEKVPDGKEFCPVLVHDLVCSNIGNLDVLIPTQGDNVRLIHLMRSSKLISCNSLFLLHSFRGRLMYSFCYWNTMKTEIAETLMKNISDTINDVC